TLNHLIRERPAVAEIAAARVRRGDELLLAAPVHFELIRYLELKGASQLIRAYRKLTRFWTLVDLTFSDWSEAALLWADRHREGKAISDLDLLLAVIARREDAVLVTSNTRHFEGLGIALEDWGRSASD